MSDTVYVRYGTAVTNMTDAISLLLNNAGGVYVRVNSETWENGEPVGVTLSISEENK
jgi:hypothetical protein